PNGYSAAGGIPAPGPGGHPVPTPSHAPSQAPAQAQSSQSPSPPALDPAQRTSATRAVTGPVAMQVAMVWHSQILRYELLRHARRVTAGPSKHALLTTPRINGKNKFTLARPKRGAYVVQLAAGMTGDIQQAGKTVTVADLP